MSHLSPLSPLLQDGGEGNSVIERITRGGGLGGLAPGWYQAAPAGARGAWPGAHGVCDKVEGAKDPAGAVDTEL